MDVFVSAYKYNFKSIFNKTVYELSITRFSSGDVPELPTSCPLCKLMLTYYTDSLNLSIIDNENYYDVMWFITFYDGRKRLNLRQIKTTRTPVILFEKRCKCITYQKFTRK